MTWPISIIRTLNCICVVMDNLSTHNPGALYETFPASEAHRILQRLEFHYTPKHASWLNMVEIEIGVLRGQCLDRRIGERETLTAEIEAWAATMQCLRRKDQMEVHHTEGARQTGTRLSQHRQRSHNLCDEIKPGDVSTKPQPGGWMTRNLGPVACQATKLGINAKQGPTQFTILLMPMIALRIVVNSEDCHCCSSTHGDNGG